MPAVSDAAWQALPCPAPAAHPALSNGGARGGGRAVPASLTARSCMRLDLWPQHSRVSGKKRAALLFVLIIQFENGFQD